jgi:hypothetical protein
MIIHLTNKGRKPRNVNAMFLINISMIFPSKLTLPPALFYFLAMN